MKPEYTHTNKAARTYRWMPLLLIGLLTLIVLIIIRGFPSEKRFAVVQLKGKGITINLSKSFHFAFFPSETKHNGAILAEKNDLLGFNDTYIRYPQQKEDTLRLSDQGDSIVFLNGKVNSLIINKDGDLLPWFNKMKPGQLNELGSVFFKDPIPDSYIPYLKEIARQHPQLSLAFNDHDSTDLVTDYLRKADFFQPSMVSIPVSNEEIPALAHWKRAKCLYITLTDSVIRNPLPALPEMKECIVFGDYIVSMPPDFLKNNPQLKKLSLLLDGAFYHLVTPLEKLDELVLSNGDSTAAISTLKQIPEKLSVLIISGRCTGIDQLSKARGLKWLGLPSNTTQPEFNQLTSDLKQLQVLEMAGDSNITDFRALEELADLRGLVIIDTVTDKNTIRNLKKLRYLSLPFDSKEDSTYLKEMEKALPGCIVVANSGACLGSGWLLLLIPIALLSGLLMQKRKLQINEISGKKNTTQ